MPRPPHRRSPPPPPLISLRGRLRSPAMHHFEMSTHGREPQEYRPVARRTPPPKRRSFSPPLKRKISPSREREMSRRPKMSKVPRDDEPDPIPYTSSRKDSDFARSSGGGPDRYRVKDYKEERERGALTLFRGPEGPTDYDVDALKKFTVEIVRNHDGPSRSGKSINRTITNPDDIAPVRRPGEGVRPLFLNAEIAIGSKSKGQGASDEYRRVVAMDSGRQSGRNHDRGRSPGFYEEPKRSFYPDRREPSPFDRHRSPQRHDYIEPREKIRERRGNSKDDLRRDLEMKRKEERRFSPDRRSYERDSDLRKRLIERRNDPFPRLEDKELRRYEDSTRHSPPPRSFEHHGFRPNKDDDWKMRENGNEWKRPLHVREREDRGRDNFEEMDRAGPSNYKNDFPTKKFFKHDEEKEFAPRSFRGRGSSSIRRGSPSFIRGRGSFRGNFRGSFRGFRGGSSGTSRGAPRGSFRGSRGYPTRKPYHT